MRFTGSCEPFASVDITEMAAWIAAIPFSDWPQQHKVDEQLRPAMVTDLTWHGFGVEAAAIVGWLSGYFPGCAAYQLMLSVVMQGHSIEPHTDAQPPNWITRVHVPLLSNDAAWFDCGGKSFVLKPGSAYKVNTEAEHGIRNLGTTPRVHFMWDVRNA
jgi:hypothetical protein